MSHRATRTAHACLLLIVAVICGATAWTAPMSSDLLALWLAGQAFADGLPHLIYPAEQIFTLRPPDAWIDMAAAAGHQHHIFPYIYPPLTAAIMAEITQVADFSTFSRAAHWVNIALGLFTSWLAWRATGRVVVLPVFLCVGALLFHLTIVGSVALEQGQPQILVAFLTVLAIERLHARSQLTAGAVLAVAAAIKVYPVLFVVFFMARRQWRATASFAATGAALGLLSILLAGWSLHAAFLAQLAAISHTGIVLPLTFSLDSLVATLQQPDLLIRQTTAPAFTGPESFIGAVEKGPLWATLNKLAMLAALGGLAVLFARSRRILLWPAAMIVLALLSPLAWSYHFLAAVAFAPALLGRWHPGVPIAVFAPLALHVLGLPGLGAALVHNLTPIGATAMVALAIAMLLHPRDLRKMSASRTFRGAPAR